MLAGVTWVLEQNADPTSVMYQRIDTTHIGATGHSQGGFATTTAGADARITTIAPLCGATTQRNLHGPAMLFCGGMDTTVPCSTIMNAYNGITNQPIMLAELPRRRSRQLDHVRRHHRQARRGRRHRLDARPSDGRHGAARPLLRRVVHAVPGRRLAGDAQDDGPVGGRTSARRVIPFPGLDKRLEGM